MYFMQVVIFYIWCCWYCQKKLKGYFTSGKMKVYLIFVIYIVEMWN